MYYQKAVLKKFQNFTEKNLQMSLFLNKVAGLHYETFFNERQILQKILLFFTLTSATNVPSDLVFSFSLIFSEQTLLFSESPKQLAVTMEI